MEPNQKSCSACGSSIEQEAMFCPSCGAKQEAPPAIPDVQIPGMPDLTPPDFTPPSFDIPATPTAATEAAPAEAAAPVSTTYTPPTAPGSTPPTQPSYTGYTTQQNGYTPPASGGYSAPSTGGYTPPPQNGGYTAPSYSTPPVTGGATYSQPPFNPTVTMQQPKKKSPVAAIVIAVILVIAIVGGIFIFTKSGTAAFDIKTYTSPFVWDGTVEYSYNSAGELGYSYTATNTSDKTIVYFENLLFYYDANGNQVLDEYDENWCPEYDDTIYLRPGETHTPEEYGYWYMYLPEAEYIYVYVNYIEYSDGSWEGIPYYVESDFTDLQILNAIDYVNSVADTWAKQQAK